MKKIFLVDNLTQYTATDYKKLIAYVPRQKQLEIFKMKHCQGRIRSIIAYALLVRILLQYYGVPQNSITFTTSGRMRKPRLSAANLPEFNISHTSNKVVLVLDDAPIGIDIERIQSDTFGVGDMFHYNERMLLQHAREKARIFTSMWCVKEAYGKNCGIGINETILRQCIFLPQKHFTYDHKKISVLTYDDHIIALCGAHFYADVAIEHVRREALCLDD